MSEYPDAYVHTTPTARKTHSCCECGGVIKKGEQYVKHSGVWDHRGRTYKVCPECEELRTDMNEGLHPDDHICIGGLWEEDTVEHRKFGARFRAIRSKRPL